IDNDDCWVEPFHFGYLLLADSAFPCLPHITCVGIADHSEYTYDKLKLSMRQQQFMICCVLYNMTPAMTYKRIRAPRRQKDATINFKATKSMRKVTVKSLPIEPMQTPRALGRRLRAVREQRRLTIDQVASYTRLSKGFLSRVER